MSKLRTAVIGQGRSGRDIHGKFFKSQENDLVEVVTVVETDPERMERALTEYPGLPVLYAGGVMSNKLMRKRLSDRFTAYFAEPEFSADNAAGVALICRNKMMKGDS